MPAARHGIIRRPLSQRLCAGAALLCYLATSSGFAVPAGTSKECGQRFPCENHPCGCVTAEECWTHCCCFSPAQHWAWAQASHVEPPSYAERPRDEGWSTPRRRDCCAQENGACCAGHEAAGCCGTRGSVVKATEEPSPSQQRIEGFCSVKCRGGLSHWIAIGAVAPPQSGPRWQMYWPLLDWLTLAGKQFDPQTCLVLDPPPRSLHLA